ncbi:MAG: LysR family transcriptional regulator [Bosea sp. (in: a-proteobacteria)]|uniref:LysR family transcriptional regulator n=1 Tax=Bosea TaxID=85413 RepID=UPI00214F6F86|nr:MULTISPECIES: LysR family transcriptional regulator [Bosea]MCR4524542.1 LysR family transcriptional regulator [Bosea sp. 47.2.35]MDR6831563.1 DNA-binding transcriptional LysR family regulator [Bosea robiniae]MDR6898272.1 DNA-binding transcriptional LysR family regulator [Bosea sp. BE109]MDR7141669.1 DNA-binding transcriptional LysR family regulator [Bosea sp. BE168]MDR7178274.1 DNA-binding transcriptional LysR family regulator [Bosea sp. BE271]
MAFDVIGTVALDPGRRHGAANDGIRHVAKDGQIRMPSALREREGVRFSHVEAFRAVMITGSTTAAARILHTSQPNVSRSIAQLEKAIGLQLFERMPGKVVPTTDGLTFFNEVQRSFHGLRRLEEAANRIRRFSGGLLRIGSIQTLAHGLIPRAIKRFAEIYPETGISIHAGHSAAVSQWVDEMSCDVGIVSHLYENYGFSSEELYSVDGVCLMPAEHRLAGKAAVRPADLADEPYISFAQNDHGRSDVDEVFSKAGIDRRITLETPFSTITCALVAQGLGVAIVNPLAAQDYRHLGVVMRPFRPSIKHEARLIYPKGRPENRLVASFIEILKAVTMEEKAALSAVRERG